MLITLELLTSESGMWIAAALTLLLALFSAYAGYRDLKNTVEKKTIEKKEAEQAAKKVKAVESQKKEQQQKETEQLRKKISELEMKLSQVEAVAASCTRDAVWEKMADTGPLPVLETSRALSRMTKRVILGYKKDTTLTFHGSGKISVGYDEAIQDGHLPQLTGSHEVKKAQTCEMVMSSVQR